MLHELNNTIREDREIFRLFSVLYIIFGMSLTDEGQDDTGEWEPPRPLVQLFFT